MAFRCGMYPYFLLEGGNHSLENETGEQIYRSVEDDWLVANGLDVGSLWSQEE